jgi:hypothetical protein
MGVQAIGPDDSSQTSITHKATDDVAVVVLLSKPGKRPVHE